MSVLGRGLLAGAAGTAVLNAVGYLDMAVRGRDASSTPEATAQALADAVDLDIPGSHAQRSNRVTAIGALLGTSGGLLTGMVGSVIRSRGFRLPAPLEAVLAGAGAMVAGDVPIAALGVSDPRTWSRADWTADIVPHLAYGAATSATLRAMDGDEPVRRAGAGLVARSALIGLAAGSRSTLGFSAPVLAARPTAADPHGGSGRLSRAGAATMIAGEMVADKMPSTPDRTERGLPGRLLSGSSGASALARREGCNTALPSLVGAAGALAGSFGGLAWRRWAGRRGPDWQGALVEDAVALATAYLACRVPARDRVTAAA